MKYVERFFRYVFWVVVTATIAWVIKKAFQRAARQNGATGQQIDHDARMAKAKELFRDPVCGTYVAEDVGYSLMQGRESLHFCSRDCMEHFRAGSRLASGA
jgi:YHS domain-containing protein